MTRYHTARTISEKLQLNHGAFSCATLLALLYSTAPAHIAALLKRSNSSRNSIQARRQSMRTMLLAAAAALTLNAGVALADSGDSFDFNRWPDTQTNSSQGVRSAQPQMAAPNGAQTAMIAHGVSQNQDTRWASHSTRSPGAAVDIARH